MVVHWVVRCGLVVVWWWYAAGVAWWWCGFFGAARGEFLAVEGGGFWTRVTSDEQFVGVGYEVEEGLEVCFVFAFVEFVIESAFFGICFVLFFLFDEQFGGQDFAAEVAVVEGGIVDAFVEDL